MKKILILEDSHERIQFFKNKLDKKYQVVYYDNVEKAKEYLNSNEVDILFLDHDLDQRIFVNSCEENTGYQFAKYVAESGKTFEQIIIHSMNTIGSKCMADLLQFSTDNLERIPFCLLRMRLK